MGFSSGCGLRTAVLSSPAGAAKDANACPCEGRFRGRMPAWTVPEFTMRPAQ